MYLVIAKGRAKRPSRGNQRMVRGNKPLRPRRHEEIDVSEDVVLTDDQPAARASQQDRQRVVTEVRGKDSIRGNGRTSAQHMAERRCPNIRFRACADDLGYSVPNAAEPHRVWARGIKPSDGLLSTRGHCTFRYDHNGETRSAVHTAADELLDRIFMEGDLGDQNHVRSARHTGSECNPSRIPPHHFTDHHTVMTIRRGMQSIQCFGRGVDGGEKTESDLRAEQIVVDRFWDPDDIDASLHEWSRTLHRTITTDDDQSIDTVLANIVDACSCDIPEDRRAIRVKSRAPTCRIAAVVGAEDRSTSSEDARDIAESQRTDAILNQPLKSILNAEHFDSVLQDGGLGDRTDDRIQAGTVAATSQDADSADGFGAHRWTMEGSGCKGDLGSTPM